MAESILIVDDDMEVRDLCMDSLSNEEYEVVTSASGEEAYELAQKNNFDLVLSDIRMPGMDGLELFSNLRELDPNQSIIMFSGFGDVDAAVEAMKQGAFDYLSKPLILDELKITIKMALQQNRLQEENKKLKLELQETLAALTETPPSIPLLANIPERIIKEFLESGKMETYDPQEIILPEGNTDRQLYIIFEGEISVRQEGSELYRLGKFDCYGEMHIFRPNLSTQCLIATASSSVLCLERDAIINFFNHKEEKLFKHFILNILNSIHKKLRRSGNRICQLETALRK